MTLDDLLQAAEQGRIQTIEGFGRKTEQRIREEAAKLQQRQSKRIRLVVAEQIAGPLVEYLKETPGVSDVVVAGSYRRQKETVADLDILATCGTSSEVMDRFVKYEDVRQIVSQGGTRSTVASALGCPGGSARGAAGQLWGGPDVLHRLQGAQHRPPQDRLGAEAEDQ